MEEEKLKTINKKHHRPGNCPNIVAPKVIYGIVYGLTVRYGIKIFRYHVG